MFGLKTEVVEDEKVAKIMWAHDPSHWNVVRSGEGLVLRRLVLTAAVLEEEQKIPTLLEILGLIEKKDSWLVTMDMTGSGTDWPNLLVIDGDTDEVVMTLVRVP